MQIKAKELLVAIAVKNNGVFNEIIRTIRNKEPISNEEIAKYSHLCQNAVAIIDDDYPKTYKNINMPPLVLFLKDGDHSLLTEASKRGVCILDDRKTSKINEIVGEILDHGCTIAVPNFENGEIMLENKQHFLFITEYPDGCYDKDNEVQRARVAFIASGLCGRLFVGYGTSAPEAKVAVSCALDAGSDVCVAPTSIDVDPEKSINNGLIKDGADVVIDWKDVFYCKDEKIGHKHDEE